MTAKAKKSATKKPAPTARGAEKTAGATPEAGACLRTDPQTGESTCVFTDPATCKSIGGIFLGGPCGS